MRGLPPRSTLFPYTTLFRSAVRDPRVCVLIDRGREWGELTGARVEGVAELLPAEHPDLREPMSTWHEKYRSMFTGDGFERFARSEEHTSELQSPSNLLCRPL